MPSPNAIALIDIGCLFKRTFEANPNAGAQNSMTEIIRIEERVAHVVICLDSPPYSRKELFPEYKAHREEPTTSETYQKRWLYEQLKERGYPMARVKGAEGDDVIATLARIYGESWAEVWLVGADKDLAQCVTDNVLQLVPKHGQRAEYFRGPKEVKEKFEVTPEQIPLFLALTGDKSDNVPGVKGIGPVKAAGLIAEHKTLTGIAERLATGAGPMWEALRANWEQLVLSLKLTTLDSKLPLDAQALLVRAEPKVAETMAPKVELEFDGFMGNATPMPEPEHVDAETAAAHQRNAEYVSNSNVSELLNKPQPIIGKDPRADEFMRQEHEAREQRRNADRAAQEQHDQEQKREEEWRAERRGTITEAKLADMPAGTPKPKVTEAEFIPFGQPAPAAAPPPAPKPTDRPGLAKTTPEYGLVTEDLQPKDLRGAEVVSKWLLASNLYPQFTSAAAIFAVIARGKEMGIGMTTALAGFHVVEGKPTASADLIRALAVRSKKCKYLRLVHSDAKSATWEARHADHPEPTTYTYTIEEAEAAGLLRPSRNGKPSNWATRPRDLLTKTAGSKLCRILFPEETLGLYCPEEMGDYVDTVGVAA